MPTAATSSSGSAAASGAASASSTRAPARASAIDPGAHDLIYIGGGQDRDQRLVAADMVETKREALAAAVDDGAVVLAVCGGYQLLGHSYQLGEERIAGLGLADLETVREEGPRLIGNVAIEVDLGDRAAGPRRIREPRRAHLLGDGATPLGRVIKGHGNDGKTASRACAATTCSAPTSTARSCRRTPGSPTA